MSQRILIVGGVAGGASCAARLRRISEEAEIIVFDRGPYVSFANCGLPYYVGDVIQHEQKLLVATADLFRTRFNVEVRTESEITAIDRESRTIEVHDLRSGKVYRERYDALVLAPGANSVRPPLPGIDLPGIFVLQTIPDSRSIKSWIEDRKAQSAVIVGGGFIGLEMAENLIHLGLGVTIVGRPDQVLPRLDPEMAELVQRHITAKQVNIRLGDAVAAFEKTESGRLQVTTQSGQKLETDMVVLSMGVRPETGLAQQAGLQLGELGGIRVDESMRTSDPSIWAVGDAVECKDFVTGSWTLAALAGPANRQGRVAADSICGRGSSFRGVQATTVVGVLGLTAASTGASEKALRRAGIDSYAAIYLHPGQHAGYYPGASPIHMKLLFSREDGRILGAQAVGTDGVEKRIDVIAMAIQNRATVYDLEEAELCYAPQYGSAKDPINMAGMIAANVLRGDAQLMPWPDMKDSGAMLIDVREPQEFAAMHIPGAINLPLSQLRQRLAELPRDRELMLNCGVGQRSYYALRILVQNGFKVRNLSGGINTFMQFRDRPEFQ
jgi:NADPH-dependent 2,4-dienoyl-CoA reductase/sulfur reductase-like enzyme/rhodanese-related sulfurtransferase